MKKNKENKMNNKLLNWAILFIILILAAGIAGCRSSAKLEMSPLNLSSAAVISGQSVDVESTVTNSGGTEGKLSATFKVDNEAVETTEISIKPAESKKIVFHYTALTPRTHQVEINGIQADLEVLRPAEFQLSALKISPSEILPKQTITVNTDISNLGDVEGMYSAKLTVDEKTVAARDILVKPGTDEDVAFTCTIDSTGTHSLQLGDLSKNVTVLKPAEFTITEMNLDNPEIAVGKPVTVTAQVSNKGEVSGSYTAALTIDGKDVESKGVVVGPGAAEMVTFGVNKNTPGSYQIALGPQTKTLSVFEPQPFLLQHDNHVISSCWSSNEPRGQWVKFSPPSRPFVIQKVIIGGRRPDFSQPEKKNYTINILNKDFTRNLYSADYPYSNFSFNFSMVEHEIKPELNIKDDFYVEIISHSEIRPAENNSEIGLYVGCDYTVADNLNSGYSKYGDVDSSALGYQISKYPQFSAFSWIIRVGGAGKALHSISAPSPEKVVVDPALQTLVSDVSSTLSKTGRYKIDLDMQAYIEMVSGKESDQGNFIVTGKGYLNKIDKEMNIILNLNVDILGKKAGTTSETYITQGWKYEKPGSNKEWKKTKLTDELWNSGSKSSYLDTDRLKSPSSIELIGNETIDGVDCQVLKIKPDLSIALNRVLLDQYSSFFGLNKIDTSFIKELTVKEWIAKDTHLPLKEEVRSYAEIGPEILGLTTADFDKMNMTMIYVIKFYDYNITVPISLPPAALKAP
jgi:hypothetical protein